MHTQGALDAGVPRQWTKMMCCFGLIYPTAVACQPDDQPLYPVACQSLAKPH
jgi:hypothetical protein